MMMEVPPAAEGVESDLGQRLAQRLRALRLAQGDSLEELAKRSGVSRSMISLVERGQSSPTAVVLEKLAAGLGVMLPELFDPSAGATAPGEDLARREAQPLWRDPASGYQRRNVSPPSAGAGLRISEVRFPAGGRVVFDNEGRDGRVRQQVWVLEGRIEVGVGDERHELRQGDCLAMRLDRPTMFHNPGTTTARYAVVTATSEAGVRP